MNDPQFYLKNRAKLEKAFDSFDEPITHIKELTGGQTQETELTAIISQMNPITRETYANYDIEIKILNREKPQSLEIGDDIQVASIDDDFTIDEVREQTVTTTLECSKTT